MSFVQYLNEQYKFDSDKNLWYPAGRKINFDYSDGNEVEERLLSILTSASDLSSYSIELRNAITDWPTLYHLSPNRSNLLRPFANLLKGEVLELGAGFGALSRFIAEQGGKVLALEGSQRRAQGASLRCRTLENVFVVVDTIQEFNLPYQFDVVTLIGVLEYARKYFPHDNYQDGVQKLLSKAFSLLKPDGLLFVAIENQLGLKYFCGSPEDHYGLPFYGINDNYPENEIITFGKRELETRLRQAGFKSQSWWYPFPDYKLPVSLFSDLINEEINYDFSPIIAQSSIYDPQKPRNPIFSLEKSWSVVLRNGLISSLANSFLILARKDEYFQNPDSRVCCYYSLERRKEFAKEVIFRKSETADVFIEKKLLFPDHKPEYPHPLSILLPEEDLEVGENWQWTLVKKLNKPNWSLQDIREWAKVWFDSLLRHLEAYSLRRENINLATPLPGDLFDAVPRNLVITKNSSRFIDQKWKLAISIDFGYLLFRGLFLSLLDVSSVEMPQPGTPTNVFTLYKLLAQSFGFWVTTSDFSRYLQMESDIQQWALGREVQLNFETYYGFNLNVRKAIDAEAQLSLITNQLYEREQALEALRAELRLASERAAGLEAQLAEREQALEGLRAELRLASERAAGLEAQLAEREQALEGLRAELHAAGERAAGLEAQLAEREQALEALRAELHAAGERAAGLEAQLAEQEQALEGLRAALHAAGERAAGLEAQLAEREQQNTALSLQKAAVQQELDAVKGRYESLQQYQQEREQILQDLNNKLLEIYSSTAWKIIQWMWRVRLWLFPRGSWRENFAKSVYHLLLHPKNNLPLKKTKSVTTKPNLEEINKIENSNKAIVEISKLGNTQSGLYVQAYEQMLTYARRKKLDDYFDYRKHEDPLNDDLEVKLIAFYLPQFHPIPENDEWWGKGFTEWTNVTRAIPQFLGHYQPHLPTDLGFYDLRIDEIQENQVNIARNYGIYGFCFYYYWFSGKRLLELPLNSFVNNPNIDFPFCVMWANENWTRRWDGLENEVLISQDDTVESNKRFIKDLIPYLRHKNYIKINGRPLILVYNIRKIDQSMVVTDYWRQYCIEEGVGNPFLVIAQTFGNRDNPREHGFDAAVEFPPHGIVVGEKTNTVRVLNTNFRGRVYDYADLNTLKYDQVEFDTFRTVMTSWDNTPRRLEDGSIFINSTPYHYQTWLTKAIKATVRSMPKEKRFVFINAWNEWAEGAHLEPDKKFGYGYLQACRNALQAATHSIFSKNVEIPIETHSDTLVIIHAFYPELLDEILSFMPNINKKIDLLITTPHAERLRKESNLIHQYVDSTIVELPNIGRDIAPFLSVLPTVINKGYRYACKLHTKKTVHRNDGDVWRKNILSCLFGVEDLDRIFTALEDGDIALIGPHGHVLPSERYWWKAENKLYVKQLEESLGLPKNFKFPFVAGSMFWFSPKLLEGLTFLPLSISDFGEEKGEVDGTLAHGIERFIGAYVYLTGKKIGEIDRQGNISIVDYDKLLDINFPFAAPTEDPLPDL